MRWLGGAGQPPPGRTTLDTLKERFARGEFDKAEFEDRRRALGEVDSIDYIRAGVTPAH